MYHANTNNLLGSVADIVTILGIFGLLLAYIDYRNKLKEEKRKRIRETINAITSIKSQLKTIGHWTGYDNGGYKEGDAEKWIQTSYLEISQPFHKVYKLEYSYLKNISALPGIESFDESTNQALAWLIQWCSNFNSFLEEIENFKYSRAAEKNILLNQKAKAAKSNKEFYGMLDEDEKFFTDNLLNMYTTLHFQIIADENKQFLHFWHKRLLTMLDSLEVAKKKELEELN